MTWRDRLNEQAKAMEWAHRQWVIEQVEPIRWHIQNWQPRPMPKGWR